MRGLHVSANPCNALFLPYKEEEVAGSIWHRPPEIRDRVAHFKREVAQTAPVDVSGKPTLTDRTVIEIEDHESGDVDYVLR